jgi:hypothetical protein
MAQTFLYGPYSSISTFGLPPGGEESWTFGPWPWYANAVTITAHPFATSGLNRTMQVLRTTSRANAAGERFIDCTVRNVGTDPANYAIWIGGVSP